MNCQIIQLPKINFMVGVGSKEYHTWFKVPEYGDIIDSFEILNCTPIYVELLIGDENIWEGCESFIPHTINVLACGDKSIIIYVITGEEVDIVVRANCWIIDDIMKHREMGQGHNHLPWTDRVDCKSPEERLRRM